MSKSVSKNGSTVKTETKEQLRLQIAQYMEQQPESKRAFHKWMKGLEVVGLGVILFTFIVAMYVSIAWKSVNPLTIPIAWFAFVASASPLAVFIGLHAIILQAFPPIVMPGKVQKFVTGSGAVWPGLGAILIGLVVAAFWGFFAYATWTQNWTVLKPMIGFLGTVMGVGIAVSILVGMVYTTIQKVFKSR